MTDRPIPAGGGQLPVDRTPGAEYPDGLQDGVAVQLQDVGVEADAHVYVHGRRAAPWRRGAEAELFIDHAVQLVLELLVGSGGREGGRHGFLRGSTGRPGEASGPS